MTQSERSKQAQAAAGWVWYQVNFLGKSEEEAAAKAMPQQFKDIFLIGFALGEERGARRA